LRLTLNWTTGAVGGAGGAGSGGSSGHWIVAATVVQTVGLPFVTPATESTIVIVFPDSEVEVLVGAPPTSLVLIVLPRRLTDSETFVAAASACAAPKASVITTDTATPAATLLDRLPTSRPPWRLAVP